MNKIAWAAGFVLALIMNAFAGAGETQSMSAETDPQTQTTAGSTVNSVGTDTSKQEALSRRNQLKIRHDEIKARAEAKGTMPKHEDAAAIK